MKLNELKRLNNILNRYTGLGKIEKDVDASLIYHSCYYLNKVLQRIIDCLESSGGMEIARPLRIKVKILEEDINKDDGSIFDTSGLRDLLNLGYNAYLFDECFTNLRLFASGERIGDCFQFTVNPDLVDTIEENIYDYNDDERKEFHGFRIDSYELDISTQMKVISVRDIKDDYEAGRQVNL